MASDQSSVGLGGAVVLVTRPTEQASYLIEQIAALGGRPIALPTLEIDYVSDGLDTTCLTTHDLAIFISRNSVRSVSDFCDERKIDWPDSLKCAAVGEQTAKVAEVAFGIKGVLCPQSEYGIDALLDVEEMQSLEGQRVIFFDGGGDRSVRLIRALELRRCEKITHAIVYDRRKTDIDVDRFFKVEAIDAIDFVVITSVEGASNLLEMVGCKREQALRSACVVAYSERIRSFFEQKGFERIIVPSKSSDGAVLDVVLKTHRSHLSGETH